MTLRLCRLAAAFALFAAQAIAQQATPAPADPARLASIEGMVVDINHRPVAEASIMMFGTGSVLARGSTVTASGYQAVSDSQGRFSFQSVQPGRYLINASHPDYSPQDNLTRLIDTLRSSGVEAATGSVAVTPGQHLAGVEITLVPMTILSGKLSDENGEPMPGATVRPMQAATVLNGRMRLANAGAGVKTDGDGKYRMTVYSGSWYLSFLPARPVPAPPPDAAQSVPAAPGEPERSYVTTYYPGVREMSLASGIDAAGREIPELNVRLEKTPIYHVRGKLVGGEITPDSRIVPVPENGSARPSIVDEGQPVHEDGTFDVAGLSPGPWTLIVCQYGKLESFGRQTVRISDGDVNDIVITVRPPAELKGSVRTIPDRPIVNPPPLTPLDVPPVNAGQPLLILSTGRSWSVSLAPLDSMLGAMSSDVQSDGALTMKNVQAGRYRVDVTAPIGGFVRSMTLGGLDCPDFVLDLSGGAGSSGSLQIVVSMTAGQINGTVTNADGAAPSAATVTLIPDGPPAAIYRPDLRPVVKTDSTGHFILTNIVPGTYRVYAWERLNPVTDLPGPVAGDSIAFSDPDFPRLFDSVSAVVTVGENEAKQVSLTAIPAAKMEAASQGRR